MSGSRDGKIRIWDVEQGRTTHNSPVLGGHDAEIDSVTFSSDDEHLISGSRDNKVVVRNVRLGVLVAGPFYCQPRYFCTVPMSIDSKSVVAGTGDDAVRVWDVELKKVVGEPFQGHKNLHSSTPCSFSRDGTRATLCSDDETVRVCDVKTGKTIMRPSHEHSLHFRPSVNSVSLFHDNKCILSCSSNGTIQIQDSEAGKSVQDPFQRHGWHLMCHFVN